MRFFDNADQLTGKAGHLRAGFTANIVSHVGSPRASLHPLPRNNLAEMEIEDGANGGARTARAIWGKRERKKKTRVGCAILRSTSKLPPVVSG